jgi:glycosyltransferase involved in cell wall biosynthesis
MNQADSSSPEVTIVIPTHNRAEFVGRAVRSALEQEIPSEVIVVDDFSSDHTSDVLAEFGDSIRVIRTERNIERGAARNLGAQMARAPIVAFLDSDDEWLPGKLERQVPIAKRGIPSVTGVEYVDEQGTVLRTYMEPASRTWDAVLLRNRLLGSGSSLVLPKELFQSVGGYPELWSVQGSEDWLLLVRLRIAGSPMETVPEPLIRYFLHPTNFTGDAERVAVCMWSAVGYMAREKYVSDSHLPKLRGHTAVVIARGFAASGRWEEAFGWMRIAIREGTASERARALALVPASGGRALLRRLGI